MNVFHKHRGMRWIRNGLGSALGILLVRLLSGKWIVDDFYFMLYLWVMISVSGIVMDDVDWSKWRRQAIRSAVPGALLGAVFMIHIHPSPFWTVVAAMSYSPKAWFLTALGLAGGAMTSVTLAGLVFLWLDRNDLGVAPADQRQ